MRYIGNVTTLKFYEERCIGCGRCLEVCPHAVFRLSEDSARPGKQPVDPAEPDACMECGACMRNCPSAAISVRPGVGCAAAIIYSRLRGKETITCGESDTGESCCG